MNTIIIQTIRAGVIFGVALCAFAGEVFAAPTLLPTSVIEITGGSAVLRGYAQSSDVNSVVWFEWSEASSNSAPAVLGMRGFYGDGFFSARLDGLNPGGTYSFRAVAKGGGATIYSPVTSFKTLGGSSTSIAGASSQGSLGTGTLSGADTASSANSGQTSSSNTQTQKVVSAKKNTAVVAVAKKTTTIASSNVSNNANAVTANGNTASVIGAGDSMFPDTLIGWMALIIAVLLVVLIVHMIYGQGEERRKKSLS
ncbi:MAG: hypothetical protein HZB12_00410 [Candidatus Yonathbacteria bacterium]|nr:hypothetical protein [Candidatus Yonathbacteria bacterium]